MDDDLVSIAELSRQYHVDESVIRSWVKTGHLRYAMVSGRMVRKLKKSEVIKPVIAEEGATNVREGTTDQVPVGGEATGLRQDEVPAGHTSIDAEIERRRWGTVGSAGSSKGRGRR